MPARADRTRALALAVAWLAYFTALQWSVVRFKVPIVVVLTASAVALAAVAVAPGPGRPDARRRWP